MTTDLRLLERMGDAADDLVVSLFADLLEETGCDECGEPIYETRTDMEYIAWDFFTNADDPEKMMDAKIWRGYASIMVCGDCAAADLMGVRDLDDD